MIVTINGWGADLKIGGEAELWSGLLYESYFAFYRVAGNPGIIQNTKTNVQKKFFRGRLEEERGGEAEHFWI